MIQKTCINDSYHGIHIMSGQPEKRTALTKRKQNEEYHQTLHQNHYKSKKQWNHLLKALRAISTKFIADKAYTTYTLWNLLFRKLEQEVALVEARKGFQTCFSCIVGWWHVNPTHRKNSWQAIMSFSGTSFPSIQTHSQ